eukprot:gene12869-12995_t
MPGESMDTTPDADICLTCPTASTNTPDGNPEGCSAAQEVAPDVCLLSKIPAHLVILCTSDFFSVQANGQAKEQPTTVTQQEQQDGKEEDEPSPAAVEAQHQSQSQQKEEQQRQIPAEQQPQHHAHSHAGQQLGSHQQLATEASKLAVTTAEQEAIKLLQSAAGHAKGLSLEALQELGSMPAWPQRLLPLLPFIAKKAQYPAPSADGNSSSSGSRVTDRADCLLHILLLVLGDLTEVWQRQCLSSLLLDLPLPAMQLLLSSERLKADSEDTVLYTAQRYLMAQPPGQQDAVRQGLAPLIRCPLLCGLQLAAHSGWNCVVQPHGTLEQIGGVGVFTVLTPLLPEIRQLAQLQRLPRPLPQLVEAIEHHISDAPASWHMGQRQSSSILQPEVSVTWKLPVEKLKAASAYYPKAEVAAYHDFEVEIRASQRHQHFATAEPCLLGDGCGFDDAFGVGVMTGDDGWDESAWVSQGLPVEGELDLQLVRMHWVK